MSDYAVECVCMTAIFIAFMLAIVLMSSNTKK